MRRLLPLSAASAGILAFIALLATPFASIGLLIAFAATRLVDPFSVPLTALPYLWWLYLWHFGADPRLWVPLALSGGIPFILLLIAVAVAISRRRRRTLGPARPGREAADPERAASRVHGDAEWMDMEEAHGLFPGPDKRWGGIPVGEAYRPDKDATARPFDEDDAASWGMGGKAPLLISPIDKGAISGLIIAGSGSYKTTAFTIPAMVTWRGSAVVLDPSLQVGPMVKSMREAMGHTVALVDPSNARAGSFNALACIDTAHPLAEVHLMEFVDWCCSPEDEKGRGNEQFFVEAGKELACCLLADLLWDDVLPPEKRTVREWRERLTLPELEMPKYLMGVFANSKSPYARQLAGTLMKTFKETFSGIYKHATSDTKWLSIAAYAELLSGSGFDPKALTEGRLTVIVQIPDEAMKATPAVGRVIIGSLARVVLRAKGKVATPIPFILDEMDLLKNMPILAVLRDMGRKSGAALFPMWQSVGQIEKTWGKEGKKSWYASAAWRLYAMVADEETADEVAKRCGSYTILTRTEGTSLSTQSAMSNGSRTRGFNDNMNEARRDLMTAYEVQTALRPDEAIVIPRGRRALRCGRPLFWRRPEMKRRIMPDRYRVAAE